MKMRRLGDEGVENKIKDEVVKASDRRIKGGKKDKRGEGKTLYKRN